MRIDAPFVSQSNHVDDVDIDRDEQSNRALVPIVICHKGTVFREVTTYHRAPARKHMVLPTYMGSRRTLKGNL